MLINSYQSRYIACRTIYPGYMTDLYVIDRKKGEFLTFPDAKPFFQGGAINYPSFATTPWNVRQLPNVIFNTGAPSYSGTQNLNSNYSSGSAGACVGARFIAYDALTVSKIYFQISAYGGTAANTNDIDIELRSGSATAVTTGGGGLLASATINPATATNWVGATSFNYTLTAGNYYWIVVGDPDGGATDFATVRYGIGSAFLYTNMQAIAAVFNGFNSTNGGTTMNDAASMAPLLVIFSNNEVMGFSENTSDTISNGNERGFRFPNGLPFDVKIHGIYLGAGSSSVLTGVKVWSGSNGPAGSPFSSGSSTAIRQWNSSPTIVGYMIGSPATFSKNTAFRATMTFSASSTAMVRLGITPTGSSDLRLGLTGRGTFYYTEASGGSWSDNQDYYPVVGLIAEEITSPSTVLANRVYPAMPSQRVQPKYGI